MQDEMFKPAAPGPRSRIRPVAPPPSTTDRVLAWAARAWRPAGTGLAVLLALMIGWHVVNGKHGLSVWQQKRVEDKQIQQEGKTLQQENDRLRARVARLKTDPDAIEREAREKLHYAMPGEVINALPVDPRASQPATQPANR